MHASPTPCGGECVGLRGDRTALARFVGSRGVRSAPLRRPSLLSLGGSDGASSRIAGMRGRMAGGQELHAAATADSAVLVLYS